MYNYVIAWVAVKLGINTTSVALEMRKFVEAKLSQITYFQYNKSGPNFHCYTHATVFHVNTILLTFVGVSMYAMYKLRYVT